MSNSTPKGGCTEAVSKELNAAEETHSERRCPAVRTSMPTPARRCRLTRHTEPIGGCDCSAFFSERNLWLLRQYEKFLVGKEPFLAFVGSHKSMIGIPLFIFEVMSANHFL